MKKKPLLIAMIIVCSFQKAVAQDGISTRVWDLASCIDYALEQNIQIKKDKIVMTFKNKHSFISGFLGAALLIASGCALGGCTEIADEPQGIDDALTERLTEKAKFHFDAELCATLAEAVELAHANTRRGLLVCGSEAAALEAAALLENS